MPRKVASTGLMVDGDLVWEVRAWSPRHRRARKLSLLMPVLAGEPQPVRMFQTSNGLLKEFNAMTLQRYMNIRQTVETGKRRPFAQISFSG